MSLGITVLPLRVLSERLSEPRGRAALVLTYPQEPAENLRPPGAVSFDAWTSGLGKSLKGMRLEQISPRGLLRSKPVSRGTARRQERGVGAPQRNLRERSSGFFLGTARPL